MYPTKIKVSNTSSSTADKKSSTPESGDVNLLEIIKQQGELIKETIGALKEIRGLGVSVPPVQNISTPAAEQPATSVNRTVSFDLFGDIPLKNCLLI